MKFLTFIAYEKNTKYTILQDFLKRPTQIPMISI